MYVYSFNKHPQVTRRTDGKKLRDHFYLLKNRCAFEDKSGPLKRDGDRDGKGYGDEGGDDGGNEGEGGDERVRTKTGTMTGAVTAGATRRVLYWNQRGGNGKLQPVTQSCIFDTTRVRFFGRI